MVYDFDTVRDRRGTASLKFDFATERHRPEDVLSYWVADMDFPTADGILQALQERVRHGIFGYTDVKPPYFEAVARWYGTRFGYRVQPEWLCVTPGIVMAIGVALQAFTDAGDAVLVQSPVYYPFAGTVEAAGRTVVRNPLQWGGGRYQIDFDDFEKKVTDGHVKLFLLCNPHNPGSTSWTREELLRMGNICRKHGVIVLSDEIHSDFVWEPHAHTMFASLSPELERLTVTCTAPTKTFNLAGLQISNIFIADENLRARFHRALDAVGYSQPNTLGLTACEAAYTCGGEWLSQVRAYIQGNIQRTVERINGGKTGIRAYAPEATYLVWLDCTPLGLSERELNHKILREAKVWLDAGHIFGTEALGFQRMNVATPWSYLAQGLERLEQTLAAR